MLTYIQVLLHTQLEKNLPKFILQRVDKHEVIEYPNAGKAQLGMIDQFFKYFSPKSKKGMLSIIYSSRPFTSITPYSSLFERST